MCPIKGTSMLTRIYSDEILYSNGSLAIGAEINVLSPKHAFTLTSTVIRKKFSSEVSISGSWFVDVPKGIAGDWYFFLPDGQTIITPLPDSAMVRFEDLEAGSIVPIQQPTIFTLLAEHEDLEAGNGVLGHVDYDSSSFQDAILAIVGSVGGILRYQHTQASPSTSWLINHNFGIYPIIDVLIGSNKENCQITHNSVNQSLLTFSLAKSGIAICKG
jgi:hypothetical protein